MMESVWREGWWLFGLVNFSSVFDASRDCFLALDMENISHLGNLQDSTTWGAGQLEYSYHLRGLGRNPGMGIFLAD